MSNIVLKEAFDVAATYEAFYTGGNVQWSTDGQYIFCQKYGTVSILSWKKGIVTFNLGENNNEDEDTINSFIASSNDINIVTHHKSGLFKLWNWKDNKVIKLWKSLHKGPVSHIAISTEKNLMASGGSDGTVRLWDLKYHVCTHNLKGLQGVISVLAFHPNVEKELIFAASDDFKIYGWNAVSGEQKVTLSGHFSKVTSLSFHKNGNYLVSSGRDRVLILWNIALGSSIRVLPVYEEIVGTFAIPENISMPIFLHKKNENDVLIAAAGEKGIVKIWEMRTGREMYVQQKPVVSTIRQEENAFITHLLYNDNNNNFAVVTIDHNIIIYSLETFECMKQLVGYSDEILDIVYFGDKESHIAIATNSCDIKLYDVMTMNCQLLCGHTDIVLSLATTPNNSNLLLSSAKDNSVRLWLMDNVTAKVSCIASAIRHTASVSSLATSQASLKFFVSVSQDLCLKLWDFPKNITSNDICSLNVVHTIQAHQKDINSVTVSPNDKLIATGSQDKTAKLWSSSDLKLLGVFRGHRRGIWCVRFSPVDQILLTASADCTMKLWSLMELYCLKTLEGHGSSVLRAEFLTRGMQLITASGDGLLKLWSIKTSECLCTLEKHNSRVWSLVVRKDEKTIISGGSDSLLVIWKDVTEERKMKVAMEKKQLALEEQKLTNLLKANKLTSALRLSLKLQRPLQVLNIIESLLNQSNFQLEEVFKELKPMYKEELLKCAITWNTNSKNSYVAQAVIHALIMETECDLSMASLSSTLESAIPYTDRHYMRITKLLQDLHLFDYTLNRMKPHVTYIGI